MEVDSFQNERKIGFKAVHPKVINILMKMKVPSPTRLVSDILQPITGSLAELQRDAPKGILGFSPMKTEKKAVTLNLSLNRMKNRRGDMNK
ncbi:hypothetical protein SteCoe_2433 [Stentor coeruleus]|uniref:Uncharacterized protein n=1 Tax=Stentor coeruleus TaxID=5963 RepID=A0A1R2CZF6_9CILI|nr:hypothetical protein SteCoe_2433 [Stentor coeruleus]